MNTTANALLSIGVSPVMAHAVEEVEDMTSIAGALVINIGTLSPKWIEAMSLAMKTAKQKEIPIVFDPVGAGATKYRTDTCKLLLNETRPSIIRGNASEIMSLLDANIATKGVDSAHSADSAVGAAKELAESYSSVVSVSGEVDLITDGREIININNGHAMMPKVTGLGCTATAITGAFAAVNKSLLDAAANAMAVMGICGEIAAEKSNGPGTLQLNIIDAFYNLNEEQIKEYLK
jgi:hydroxyethylthiazole kinase